MLDRQTLDTILIARAGSLLTTVGKDGATADGTNPDLTDAIRVALRLLGYSVASLATVTDIDLASVASDDEEALIDVAEYRLLVSSIQPAAAALVDTTVGPRSESRGQFAKHLETMIGQKAKAINELYGAIFGDDLEAGVFSVASIEDGTNVY